MPGSAWRVSVDVVVVGSMWDMRIATVSVVAVGLLVVVIFAVVAAVALVLALVFIVLVLVLRNMALVLRSGCRNFRMSTFQPPLLVGR